jgi:hypothetical protein
MLARLSHLLQPLDVGCFSVLKQLYGSLVCRSWAAVLTTSLNANSCHCIGRLGRQHCIRTIYRQGSQLQV